MFAPAVFESGSSVSHWSKTASPNLLMEPVLSGLDFADVDLTAAAFKDIGWSVFSVNTNTYTIGGTVSGLATDNEVVLQNNSGDNLTVNDNGLFTFATALDDGSSYAVTVLTQPTSPSQTCNVTGGSGSVAGADVTNVSVICVTGSENIFTDSFE